MTDPLHPDHPRVQAAAHGEPSAVEWLAARLACIPRMVRFLAAKLLGRAEADLADIAQEAASEVLRRLDAYHGRAPFDAWVYKFCVHAVQAAARASRRAPATSDRANDVPDGTEGPVDELLACERRQQLLDAITAIGGVEAEVIRLKHFEQMEFRDIAAATDMELATVRTRYYRALKKLQLRLDDSSLPGAAS